MTPEEVTQPYYQSVEPRHWPPSAPTRQPQHAPKRSRAARGYLWATLGFLIGVVITGLLALALFSAPNIPVGAISPSGVALKVTLTDALLTSQIAASQRNASGIALANPRAHIQADGRLVISGTLQGMLVGSGSTATVVMQPYVQRHTLAISLVSAKVGGITVPPALLGSFRDQINSQLAKTGHLSLGADQALMVGGVAFENGAMTVSFIPTS